MARLANWFVQAGTVLSRPVEANFTLLLSDGRKIESVVRVSGVGAKNGVLVFGDYEAIRNDVAELAALGYDLSIMNEPRPDENFSNRLRKCSLTGVVIPLRHKSTPALSSMSAMGRELPYTERPRTAKSRHK